MLGEGSTNILKSPNVFYIYWEIPSRKETSAKFVWALVSETITVSNFWADFMNKFRIVLYLIFVYIIFSIIYLSTLSWVSDNLEIFVDYMPCIMFSFYTLFMHNFSRSCSYQINEQLCLEDKFFNSNSSCF